MRAASADCLGRFGALAGLVAVLACALFSPAGAAAVSGSPPAGYARIWLYRDYQPYVSQARPYVRFNGRTVGISEPGGAFYRDVAPGGYEITVDSAGRDTDQFARVAVVAGQQAYVEVVAVRHVHCGGSGGRACRATFYTRRRPPGLAATAIANSTFHGDK